jgi:hypothetical protein
MVLLTVAVLAFTGIIMAAYFSVSASTDAMIILRGAVMERQAFTDTPFHIVKIESTECSQESVTFAVYIEGLAQPEDVFDSVWQENIREKISNRTNYPFTGVGISINSPASCP